MRIPGGAGIQSFLAGTTDFSKVGNSAQINAAKEHGQSFENNAFTASAGIGAAEEVTKAGRYAEAKEAISGAQQSAQMAQGAASMMGSVASVFGSAGGGGMGAAASSAGFGSGASAPVSRIDFGNAWSSGIG